MSFTKSQHRDLLTIDPIKAVDEKMRRGREIHGPEWVGDHELYELHEEQLDSGAYTMKALRGPISEPLRKHLEDLMRATLNHIQGVRTAIAMWESEQERKD